MIRMLRFIFQLAVLVALALWLADRPGTAQIVWHDTVIQTSAAFLALCVVALAFALHLLFRVWHFLRHGPAHWKLRRALGKMQLGQDQLTRGLIAIASGNACEAGRLAVAARKNSGNGTAAQWLQAQAAQLAGDHRAAQVIFRELAAKEDSAVLGYRGLITEAKRNGKWDEVDRLLTELQRTKQVVPWLSLMRMESAARRCQWSEAEEALSHAVAARLLDSDSGRRTRAALRIAASRAAVVAKDNEAALQAAEQAVKQAPLWLPALINLAETLAVQTHKRAALRVIERAWKTQPHPQLALVLRRLAENPLDAFKQTERLCKGNESAVESRKALAEAALEADIWGEARRHLLACVNDRSATRDVYKMLARLERRERGDERAATKWLTKASEAVADPVWLCKTCGKAHEDWQPVCASCGSFNSLDWLRAGQSREISPSPRLGEESRGEGGLGEL
ncbi:MAG: heme biosynthesis HemY N-terminal domain-containing protein [Alphaproteobacteria bacterium]|nr:heme biosynthesis HemY N-terminal domain-containing protein [Alphaproteobacteria bacterium]